MSNISPIDGRYKKNVSELETFFSEQALMRHRVMVEVEYLLALIEHMSFQKTRALSKKTLNSLKGLYVEFSAAHFKQIKKIDKNLDIDLNKIFIILNPLQLKIKLKTVGTDIKYNEEKIQLENIKSDVSLKSLLFLSGCGIIPNIVFSSL